MIEPPLPASRIARAAAWAPKTCALRLRPSMASQPASVTSSHSDVAPFTAEKPPALLTQTSILPNSATAASASPWICARSLTSATWTSARPPFAVTRPATSSRSARVRDANTTSAPCLA